MVQAIRSGVTHLLPIFATAPSPTPRKKHASASCGHFDWYSDDKPDDMDSSTSHTVRGSARRHASDGNNASAAGSYSHVLKFSKPVQLASQYESGIP
mmetsp:Transcript_1272/g.2799  ORF Transcript_1272/g.2799 Transcript_1272/m.2799 type:complete len:97 (-) Transcript_1272:783-1073(-)